MSAKSRLDKLRKTCQRIRLPENAKILFIADLHENDGGPADDFKKNDGSCQGILQYYFPLGYVLVILGDDDDLWECPDIEKIGRAHPEIYILKEKYRTLGRLIENLEYHNE